MIAWLPLRDIPTTRISVALVGSGPGILAPYPPGRRAKAVAAGRSTARIIQPPKVDAVAHRPGPVDAAGMGQIGAHHDRVTGIGFDWLGTGRGLDQQTAVVAAPGTERDPDDPQVAA